MIFCIGNGKSREHLDLNELKDHGKVFGCNALYRDFSPDYLISNDPIIVNEIIESGYSKDNNVYLVEQQPSLKIPKDHKFKLAPWEDNLYPINSGWATVRLAYSLFPDDQIYMIGYDIFGDRNNIYDDTPNYPKSTEEHHMSTEWQGMFYLLVEHFCPGIKLKRVINSTTKIDNIENITYENFWKEI